MRLALVGALVPIIAVIGGTAGTAAADGDEHGLEGYLSVPITLGMTSRDGGRFAYGVRPELMFAPRGTGFAIGPYAELARSSADTELGTGLTVTYYPSETKKLNLAPSIGIYHRYTAAGETGYALSLFFGVRFADGESGADLPIGFRIDYRSDGHDLNEIVVSASVDTIAALLFAALTQLKFGHH